LTQTGCGAGKIDSNGGSDFTVVERNDTSSPTVCGTPHAGPCRPGADDASLNVLQLGNGAADSCGDGAANVFVSVPVKTTIWEDNSPGMVGTCIGNAVFDGTDMLVSEFDQILDFTTDTAKSTWSDVDPDSCSVAGAGPSSGEPIVSGVCLNTANGDVRLVAAGGFGNSLTPTYDGSFSFSLPGTMTQTGPFANDMCPGAPPLGNRCLP
jgi:hypothetical protein